jgi:hypothetical protein
VKPLREGRARAAIAWLDEKVEEGYAGYDAVGWPASVWIVNAMYETDELPGTLTYDEVERIERAASPPGPIIVGSLDVNDLIDRLTLIGSSLGRSRWPGPGWRRLLWSEMAARLEVDPYAIDAPPCYRSFPIDSWPVNVLPPAEGSLDREQFISLIDHLASVSVDAGNTTCFSYYTPLATSDMDKLSVHESRVDELARLYDDDAYAGSPSNIWPEDRSWFVYTDWDLWATKVSGEQSLIDRLNDDPQLETVTLTI